MNRVTTPRPTWTDYPPADERTRHTVVGHVKVLRGHRSSQLDSLRDIYLYLPPSYAREERRRYPVLYMQDGQNLFDAATSFAGEWKVDETMEALAKKGTEAIVVGISNTGDKRLDEYSPFRDRHERGGGKGDKYLQYIVQTLKPRIDREFRTQPDRQHTGIVGSSMGGLISLYALFKHPYVFGLAATLSPAFWFADRALLAYLEKAPYVRGRIYLDIGHREGKEALRDARAVRDLLLAKGYAGRRDLMYVEDRRGTHSEGSWARRIKRALVFLLGRPT